MKLKQLLCTLLLAIASLSLATAQTGNNAPYKLTIDEDVSSYEVLKMSDIFSSLEYVKLEFTAKSVIGKISSVYVNDDYIYVYGTGKNGLNQFSRDGKFIRKIGSYGRGPGEYIHTTGFTVNDNTISINTYDYIINYDQNGKHLNSKKITGLSLRELGIENLVSKGDFIYCDIPLAMLYVSGYYNRYIIIDRTTGEIVKEEPSEFFTKSKISFDKSKGSKNKYITCEDALWLDKDNNVTFWEFGSDAIVKIDLDGNATPKAIFEKNPLFATFDELTAELNHAYLSKLPNRIVIIRTYESDKYIFTEWLYKQRHYTSAHNKISGKTSICGNTEYDSSKGRELSKRYNSMVNDIDGGWNASPVNISPENGHWVYSIDAIAFKKAMNQEHYKKQGEIKYPERHTKLRKFVSEVSEDDNPIIVIANF